MATNPPPAWHPDPHDPTLLRWWDGTQWTSDTAPRHTPEPAVLGRLAWSVPASTQPGGTLDGLLADLKAKYVRERKLYAGLAAGGAALTAVGYFLSPGSYFILYGAIVFGGIRAAEAHRRLRKLEDVDTQTVGVQSTVDAIDNPKPASAMVALWIVLGFIAVAASAMVVMAMIGVE